MEFTAKEYLDARKKYMASRKFNFVATFEKLKADIRNSFILKERNGAIS